MPADNLPVGTVLIWAGSPNDIPSNWRVCDGKQLKKTDYGDLYSILGTRWDNDNGYQADFFSLPDLRGVFLRGVNDDRNDEYKDPDVQIRVRLRGNSTTSVDDAGSYQMSAVGKHFHNYASPWLGVGGESNSGSGNDATKKNAQQTYHTDEGNTANETRPSNAYVYFIIKVRAV